jgi:hypothetical protein
MSFHVFTGAGEPRLYMRRYARSIARESTEELEKQTFHDQLVSALPMSEF